MSTKTILLVAAAVALAFVAGFLFANSVNRAELNSLRAEVEAGRKTQSADHSQKGGNELSNDEIQAKIEEADANPNNFAFQKNLGLALARYGSMKQDPALVSQAARLLDRASAMDSEDLDIIIGLGNAAFDIGYFNKDNSSLERARDYYEKALEKEPDDAEVRTDVGMTYFAYSPPNDEKAIAEFKKALAADPKQTKAIEFMIQALVREQNRPEAEKYLAKLREVAPDNEDLPGLSAQVQRSFPAPK